MTTETVPPLCERIGCKNEQVHVGNPENLEQKLRKLIDGGINSLHLVADFDCTLTRQRAEPGCKLLSSFGMFCECPSVPEHYKNEDKRLCDIYKPIEVDPNLSVEDKAVHMVEWYRLANDLLQGFRYPDEEMRNVAKIVSKNLRSGVVKMFNDLHRSNVPVLVFSAGMGNAVVSVLEDAEIMTSNVKVISNFLNFAEDGLIDGMKGKVIHVFNKNETMIKNTEYFEMIKNRSNVLLMGDTVGDAGMADGMDHSDAVIKIGYLYHNVEGNLPIFMKEFDIVLVDDQTVDIPNNIISLVKN